MISENGILIAGGYGIVGQQIATMIRHRYPTLPLTIAGRNVTKAESLVQTVGNATSCKLHVEQPNPLKGAKPRAIVAVVNDPNDYLLMDAVHNGIPYVDITRWPERLRASIERVSTERVQAPMLLSSGWMGGIAAVLAVAASQSLYRVDRIDISVLYSVKDKSGPNSVEYMDRLATPFNVMIEGQQQQVFPYTDPRTIKFPNGYKTKVYRFDTPDQLTLPRTTGANTVSTRIAFDDAIANTLLRYLTRSGIWKLISGDRFRPLRRSLLYKPGRGANHKIVITASGIEEHGNPKTINATISDPQGQTHLTALGALVQLERLLGLDGGPPSAPGIVYPDTAPQIDHILQVLRDFGVAISISPDPRLSVPSQSKWCSSTSRCISSMRIP